MVAVTEAVNIGGDIADSVAKIEPRKIRRTCI